MLCESYLLDVNARFTQPLQHNMHRECKCKAPLLACGRWLRTIHISTAGKESCRLRIDRRLSAITCVTKDTPNAESSDGHAPTGRGCHLFQGFVICFRKVPLACLGSMAAAVQPYSLGNSQKLWNKWPPHPIYCGSVHCRMTDWLTDLMNSAGGHVGW